jgi:hypothetical protein
MRLSHLGKLLFSYTPKTDVQAHRNTAQCTSNFALLLDVLTDM